ncbi:hypothetical protein FVEG_01433 [Fusarium verticillioides 7600]|uniref:Uncharacterized protein n=1 Tax=Gibberella moniliformis (strain M3125 / FGSC 7600) TaxID=334819 RepID=W7LF58_GIBM7|nr:hypothetical protein FVEG_01433 [Fusarium verticillioides 7600]EWG38103.1 hypothetical protein FVEG_01433 [Fusarium verticillioides 7600]
MWNMSRHSGSMTNQAAYIEIQSRIWKLLCMRTYFGGGKVKKDSSAITYTNRTGGRDCLIRRFLDVMLPAAVEDIRKGDQHTMTHRTRISVWIMTWTLHIKVYARTKASVDERDTVISRPSRMSFGYVPLNDIASNHVMPCQSMYVLSWQV